VTLHVERHGRGRDVVLLHGWGLHGGAWREAIEALEDRFHLHAFDLPGHGRSAACLPAGFEEAAEMLDREIPDGAIVCGWSLGGLLAQRIARRRAHRLRALVLVSTTPCFVQRPGWRDAMSPETLADFAESLGRDRDRTLRDFVHLNALHGARDREAVRAFTRRLADHGAPPASALDTTLAWLRDTDLRDETTGIACPTLVIHGGRDALAPVAAGRWLARHIPGARLREIEDAAHLPFFTHCEAFTDAVESFVA
jgi:pimeloyl-[acyl-carrier protein] methyl ester esterase